MHLERSPSKRDGGVGNQRTGGDHPNYKFVEVSQNTEKSWRPKGTCCYSDSSERPSASAGVENSKDKDIRVKLE